MVCNVIWKDGWMDATTRKLIAEAYDETVSEALAQGHSGDVAHREGIVAGAMFLSAMTGVEDAAAIEEVRKMGLTVQ